jgi:hypothetical protein
MATSGNSVAPELYGMIMEEHLAFNKTDKIPILGNVSHQKKTASRLSSTCSYRYVST